MLCALCFVYCVFSAVFCAELCGLCFFVRGLQLELLGICLAALILIFSHLVVFFFVAETLGSFKCIQLSLCCVSSAIKTNKMRQKPKEQKMQIIVLRVVSRFSSPWTLLSSTTTAEDSVLLHSDNCFAVSASPCPSPCPQQPVIIVLWAVELPLSSFHRSFFLLSFPFLLPFSQQL